MSSYLKRKRNHLKNTVCFTAYFQFEDIYNLLLANHKSCSAFNNNQSSFTETWVKVKGAWQKFLKVKFDMWLHINVLMQQLQIWNFHILSCVPFIHLEYWKLCPLGGQVRLKSFWPVLTTSSQMAEVEAATIKCHCHLTSLPMKIAAVHTMFGVLLCAACVLALYVSIAVHTSQHYFLNISFYLKKEPIVA